MLGLEIANRGLGRQCDRPSVAYLAPGVHDAGVVDLDRTETCPRHVGHTVVGVIHNADHVGTIACAERKSINYKSKITIIRSHH